MFAPGGVLNVFDAGVRPGEGEPLGILRGVADFERLMASLRKSYTCWLHVQGSHWATVDGDTATGDANLTAHHLLGDFEEVALYRYQDRYVRTDDGWRFMQRNACRQWINAHPISQGYHAVDKGMTDGEAP